MVERSLMHWLSRGELMMVSFIFVLTWASGVLPGVGERLGVLYARKRARAARSGG
jgi:hypothetical protein